MNHHIDSRRQTFSSGVRRIPPQVHRRPADWREVLVTARGRSPNAATGSRLSGLRFDHKIALASALPWGVLLVSQFLGSGTVVLELPLIYLGAPHVLASVALFLEPGLRSHVRGNRSFYLAAPIVTVAICVAVFALSPKSIAGVAILGLTLWQIHHFTKQNLGMFSFWTKARGMASPTPAERRVIQWTALIGMAGIIRIAGRSGWIPTSEVVDSLARGVGLIALAVLGVTAVAATVGSSSGRTAGLLASVAFFAPVVVLDVGLVTAALTYQAAHGAQYYLMVGTATRPTRVSGMSAMLLLLIAGPIFLLLTAVEPYGTQAWMYGLYKGVVSWHFLADSRLWRLRDGEIRAFMKQRFAFL